jgi:carbonic anhydrase
MQTHCALNYTTDMLPAAPEYLTYQGSLTMPPCSEGVTWAIMEQPVVISARQLYTFRYTLRISKQTFASYLTLTLLHISEHFDAV